MNEHDKHLVEDFEPTPGTFRIGVKSLNIKSVSSAYGKPGRVLLVTARHLMREIPGEADSGRIVPHRTSKNYVLVGPPDAAGVAAKAEELMVQAGVRFPVRKDCIMGLELVFSVPATASINTRAFFEASLDWARNEFHPAPLISAVVHLDEPHPHLHVLVLPLIGPSMQGGQVLGFQSMFKRRSRDFFHAVAIEFGLAEPVAKPAASKAEREADAHIVLDHLVKCITEKQNLKLVRQELLKLISANPYPLGRILGAPLREHDRGNAAAGSAADARNDAALSEAAVTEDNSDTLATSTSSLCYDVEAEAAPEGSHSPAPDGFAALPIYLANDGVAAPASHADQGADVEPANAQSKALVVHREHEHLASDFNSDIGDFERRPAPARSKKAEAEEIVAQALQTRATARQAQQKEQNHD